MAAAATTAIFLDKYHPKANKKCAVSIRVTFNRLKKYYATKFSLTVQEYERMTGERPRAKLKTILLQLQSLENKAADIIERMEHFSFDQFEKTFVLNRGLSNTVNYAFDTFITLLNDENRVGTASTYSCAQVSLNKYFVENKVLVQSRINKKIGKNEFFSNYTFSHITPSLLKKYEYYMIQQGNSKTTISIYLRALRALFNNAISDGLITKEFYPFGKRKYELPVSKNVKKALKISDIAKIYHYQAQAGSTTERMKDYWMFIYYCNGINVKDMCRLKHKNIQGEFLVFERAKTESTKKTSIEIRASLNHEANAIIDKYGNKAISPEAYIFPVLKPGISALRERELIQLQTRLINDHMKIVAKKLMIPSKLTTYVARHSFATVLKRSGASQEFISESLGHASLTTTKAYLDSFEDDQKKEAAKALTAFKKVI